MSTFWDWLLSNFHWKNLLRPWSEIIQLSHRKGAIHALSLTEPWGWLLTPNQFITNFNQRWWISKPWLHFASQEAGLLWRGLLWQCWKKFCTSAVTWPLTPRNRPVPTHCDRSLASFGYRCCFFSVQHRSISSECAMTLGKAWENFLFGFKLLYQGEGVHLPSCYFLYERHKTLMNDCDKEDTPQVVEYR